MGKMTEILCRKDDLYSEKGVSAEKIDEAEKALGLVFSSEYKEYLQEFGSVSCAGHELTGFSEDGNLNVVNATIKMRQENIFASNNMYVIEETHIDGIVIWQDSQGVIYQTGYKSSPEIICDSLADYIESF